MLNKLLIGIFSRTVGKRLRDVHAGKHGPRWQAAIQKIEGWKTETGLLLGLITAVCVHLGWPEAAGTLGTVACLFVGWGLLDKHWRSSPPAYVFESQWYRFLAAHSGDIAAVLGAAALAVTACEPATVHVLGHVRLSCDQAAYVLWATSGALGWLGLRDAALKAPPPRLSGQFVAVPILRRQV